MILSGSTISNINHARKMAAHLYKDENEKVVRETLNGGTEYTDLEKSLVSMQLMTKMTKGNTGIFHVAISPREHENLTPEQYDEAIEMIERKFGFRDENDVLQQPRVRVDHVKDGRPHSHLLWSLVDQENEKLIKTSLYKRKLQKCAVEMEQKFGLEPVNRSPNNRTMQVTHTDRMVETRNKQKNPERIKALDRKKEITNIWNQSETGQGFLEGLKHAGYTIANGDKMTTVTIINEQGEKEKVKQPVLVVIDQYGTARNIARELPRTVKIKQVREHLGDLVHDFLSVEEAKSTNTYDREQENIDRQNRELDAADQTAKEKEEQEENIKQTNRGKEQRTVPHKPIQERFSELSKRPRIDKLREKMKEREKDPIDIAMDQSKRWRDIINRDRADDAKIRAFENKLRQDHKFDDLEDKLKKLKKDLAKSDTFWGRRAGTYQALLKDLEDHQIYFEDTKRDIQARVDKLKKDLRENRSPEYRPANDTPKKPEPEKEKSDNLADFEKATKKTAARQAKEEEFKARMRRQQERTAKERDKEQGLDLDV